MEYSHAFTEAVVITVNWMEHLVLFVLKRVKEMYGIGGGLIMHVSNLPLTRKSSLNRYEL